MPDLFCGGCDVAINTEAKRHLANDNIYLIRILEGFKELGSEKALSYVEKTIAEKRLSKANKESYLKFRAEYNAENPTNPMGLYVLLGFGFNYQFRFNSAHDSNSPFGGNRSSFNALIRHNPKLPAEKLPEIEFNSTDFLHYDYSVLKPGYFLYADSTYLITRGRYNDEKRDLRGWGVG